MSIHPWQTERLAQAHQRQRLEDAAGHRLVRVAQPGWRDGVAYRFGTQHHATPDRQRPASEGGIEDLFPLPGQAVESNPAAGSRVCSG
ncbi:MAG: hypothetical protein ACYCSJ_05465 [Acidimicrobiales bacterium]